MRAYRKIDEGYEVKVEGGRLVLLGAGAFLTLVLVFLVGVLVGKGLWGGRSRSLEPLAQGGASGRASEEASKPRYTFYEDLKRPDGAGQPPPPPADLGGGADSESTIPAPASGGNKGSPERSKTTVRTPAGAEPALSERGTAAAARKLPDAKAASPLFTVQVGSFKDRTSADNQVRRMESLGIAAQVVQVSMEGRTWYRVQVGKFGTRAEAEALYKKRLRPRGVQGFVTAR